MSDPTDQPPLLPPPPRRPAPEELRLRLATDLRRAERRSRAPRLVIAMAAAVALIVASGFGITSLTALRGANPVATPSATPTDSPSSGPVPSASDLALTTSPQPSPSELRTSREVAAMSDDEVTKDLKSCTKVESGVAIPHRGTYRAGIAVHAPVLTVPATSDEADSRLMYAQDEVGTFTCVDGSDDQWGSSGPGEGRTPTKTYPASGYDNISSEQSCSTNSRDGQLSFGLVWKVNDQVERARFTVRTAGQPAQVVELRPAAETVAVWLKITGPSSWEDTTWSMQFLDADDHELKIDTARNAGTPAPTTDTETIRTCTEIMKERTLSRKPYPRPASDAAGVRACRTAIKEYVSTSGESFEAAHARVALTISTDRAWGAVLRDGSRYVGCSRFPTREISEIRTSGSPLSKQSLYWAENPIRDVGETLWAAGQTDGVEAISYQLPDGQRVSAQIGKDGYWMVMASTTTAFDTEESHDDWSPVVVTATVAGRTITYSIPWTAKTSCNQVSHGC